ncbi:hypothetical protein Fmac_010041 [Flemingia macrophylla]|uniref:HMA domain-containing protein n=1 Tax=Flemingia macrophylla TaxID=520843 RepID=A0ABD1N1Y5_9FABA
MSSSLSISFPVPIPITMDSACATVASVPLFKPLKHRHLVRGRFRPLHRCLSAVTPLRFSSASDDRRAIITLNVGGMMCEGCANSVKKILESRPQVLSANVNLASETAIVSPLPEPNDLKQLGEELAQHLTTCGFTSSLRDQEDN